MRMADVRFIDNSDEAIEAMKTAVEAALEAVGQQAVSHAKQNITEAGRVDTGALRNSVNSLVVMDEEAVYVGTNQEYAIYNELGTGVYLDGGGGRQTPWSYQDAKGNWHRTRGMRPIHFLKNAAQDHADEYIQIAEQTIKQHQP
jgi:HK97 gp10 family phage protein